MSEESLCCPNCQRKYKTIKNYEKHLLTHVATVGDPTTTAASKPKDKSELTCELCPKKYKTIKGFNKHQLTHAQSGVTNSDVCQENESVNPISNAEEDDEFWPEHAALSASTVEDVVTFFEEEDEEQERLLLAAVLGTEADETVNLVQEKSHKSQGKTKKQPIAVCSNCGSKFQTLDGFIKHRMSHAMSDAVARSPSLDVVREASAGMCKEVADCIFAENINAETWLEFQLQENSCKMKEFVGAQSMQLFLASLCECLCACFKNGAKFLLPSHLRHAFVENVALLLVNKEAKDKLRLELLVALEIEDQTVDINFFLISFIRKFANKVLAFVVHWMIHDKDGPIKQSDYAVTKQSIDSSEFKELMHFIGGANVKSILRCAWRSWGQNEECRSVITTLRTNFLIGGPDDPNTPDPQFMDWTLRQDRGKLIKINNKALDFFVTLASIVKPLEHFDGSIYIGEVIEKVAEHSKILCIWEDLINDSLPKKVSFKLLFSLCEYFCNTWRSGVVRRRLDELQSSSNSGPQGTRGVAFRPKVVKFNAITLAKICCTWCVHFWYNSLCTVWYVRCTKTVQVCTTCVHFSTV